MADKEIVHRLVAEHYIDNPHKKDYGNHIDKNRLNCDSKNLEWVTNSENIRHSIALRK
jgi:hypothetical protein